MVDENPLQLGSGTPVDLEIGVVPGLIGIDSAAGAETAEAARGLHPLMRMRLIDGVEIDAPDDRRASIDRENLAMIAIVDREAEERVLQRIDGMEFQQLDPRRAQRL